MWLLMALAPVYVDSCGVLARSSYHIETPSPDAQPHAVKAVRFVHTDTANRKFILNLDFVRPSCDK